LARPRKRVPAGCCVTPQSLSPRQGSPVHRRCRNCPRSGLARCRKRLDIRLTLLVKARYRARQPVSCLTRGCRARSKEALQAFPCHRYAQ
jgi:hypothetical protein